LGKDGAGLPDGVVDPQVPGALGAVVKPKAEANLEEKVEEIAAKVVVKARGAAKAL
jgi:hypothetical protein